MSYFTYYVLFIICWLLDIKYEQILGYFYFFNILEILYIICLLYILEYTYV